MIVLKSLKVVGYVDEYLNASPKNNILNKSLAGGTHVKGVTTMY